MPWAVKVVLQSWWELVALLKVGTAEQDQEVAADKVALRRSKETTRLPVGGKAAMVKVGRC